MSSLNEAIARVTPFASQDETRPHLCAPFGAVVHKKQYLAATDGHRAALVLCDEAAGVTTNGTPPRVEHVIPYGAKHVGELHVDQLEVLRHFPKSWNAYLEIGREGCRLNATKTVGSGRRERSVKIFAGVETRWPIALEGMTKPTGVNVAYLLDAVDFVGMAVVHVWRDADPLAPFVFTATSDPILDAKSFAIVMPVRT